REELSTAVASMVRTIWSAIIFNAVGVITTAITYLLAQDAVLAPYLAFAAIGLVTAATLMIVFIPALTNRIENARSVLLR
ncbi:hypothetical protein, partial [Caballeronia sp. INML3]|uniref:hypothetical protein n=1 Tax=Caballeronia sp. INML3 TaxID=2921752 RepID=UPI002032640D